MCTRACALYDCFCFIGCCCCCYIFCVKEGVVFTSLSILHRCSCVFQLISSASPRSTSLPPSHRLSLSACGLPSRSWVVGQYSNAAHATSPVVSFFVPPWGSNGSQRGDRSALIQALVELNCNSHSVKRYASARSSSSSIMRLLRHTHVLQPSFGLPLYRS